MALTNSVAPEQLTSRIYQREEDLRGYYFRDTTAIIHSYPFRRLKHKTQVFFAPKNDHICTRIEHVMHVATISATICRALDLDVDLAWAISLGHDLGHTPFGHVGEKIITELVEGENGFVHELYSLRVVDHLINYGRGLNLTYAVRDGIAGHCGEQFEREIQPDFTVKNLEEVTDRTIVPATWEGVVVRTADKIAYLGRDLEDALQLGVIKRHEIPRQIGEQLGASNSEIIDTLVHDVVSHTRTHGIVGFSEAVFDTVLALKEFNYSRIYNSPLLANYHSSFARILKSLFDYLFSLFRKYRFNGPEYKREENLLAVRFGDYVSKMEAFYSREEEREESPVIDYLAGMTDDYAIDSVYEIMVPKQFSFQFDQFLME